MRRPEVPPDGAFALLADPVMPVVTFRKAAARPAQHRNTGFLQRLDGCQTETVFVRNGTVFTDVQAVVKYAADMLRKMPVEIISLSL